MCGVIGIASKKGTDVVADTVLGLHDLNHRGEQACGIATSTGTDLFHHSGEGLVAEVFGERNRETLFPKLKGHLAIGQDLYSTVGSSGEKKQTKTLQPLIGDFHGQQFALGHNGNLIELDGLREEARQAGYQFKSEVSDTEVVVALLSTSKETDFVEALRKVLPRLKGAFALTILYKDKVIGIRDRHGIRPLCIGYNSHCFVLASESCAFYTLNVNFIRELRPGEIIVLGKDGIEASFLWAKDASLKFSIFEFVYFARPDSVFCGRSVWAYRHEAGRISAQENPLDVDFLMASPESGRIYDEGFAAGSGILIRQGLFRNRYHTTKTFLTTRDTDRRKLQRRKIHPLKEVVYGKRVGVIEDSLIRASVIPETVGMLREAGATEVHVRICSSPVCSRCVLGIDMPDEKELIAAHLSVGDINKLFVHADSLSYISLDGMIRATGLPKESLCLGCFTSQYPIEFAIK